jgi:septum formation protein
MIVLASRSPQRRSLLAALGVPFRVVASRYQEPNDPALTPEAQALTHARGKAREVAERSGVPQGGVVLGVDTIVAAAGRALGKPRGPEGARAMLALLAGRDHEVLSAVAIVGADGERSEVERTAVRFRPLAPAARDWYVSTGEWRDRAGGYAIQGAGAALVEEVRGDYTGVVGLPIGRLVGMLADLGLAPWSDGPAVL